MMEMEGTPELLKGSNLHIPTGGMLNLIALNTTFCIC